MTLQSHVGQSFKTSDNYVFEIRHFLQSVERLVAVQVSPYLAQGIKIKEIPQDWEPLN